MRMILINNSKKYKKRKKRIFLAIILLFLFIIYFLYKLTLNASYFFINYSIREANIIIEDTLSASIDDKVLNDIKNNNLYTITKNANGDIEMIDYNSYLVNRFLNDISNSVLKSLRKEEQKNKKVAFYVPLGVITGNPLFNSIGPKIPVKMEVAGSILSNVKVKISDFGINNCLIEMAISIKVSEKVILPVISKTISVENEIPISYKIIKGKIPTYYGSSIDKDSNIFRLPIE